MPHSIVFDIGGTNMRVATAQNGELGEIKKVPTPKDPVEAVTTFVQIAKELSDGTIEKVIGDVPSSVDANGKMFDAKNLPEWEAINITEELSKGLGVQAHVFNDTALVGYGEKHKGGGRGFSRVAYITVSTGAGGALVVDEALSKSLLLTDVGEVKRNLESTISGTAVHRKFGIEPKELDSIEERNKLADILAEGLVEIAKVWKPDVFVIGGSMIVGVNPIPLERVQEKFTAVPVKMAELKDNGGLIGGAVLAMQK